MSAKGAGRGAGASGGSGTDGGGTGEAIDWGPLLAAANAVRERAYAPYSKYRVGAAILTSSGRVFAGCNVENVSYGATVCAERNAVFQMVAAGERELAAVAVVTQGPTPGTPCGVCRQVLAEFTRDVPVAIAAAGEKEPRSVLTLAGLLPAAFEAPLGKT